MRRWSLLAFFFFTATAFAQVERGGTLPQLYPADNWWNVDITNAPVDTNSAGFISWIGANDSLHPDFGGDSGDVVPNPLIYGMVYISVPGTQPLVPVTFVDYPAQSDAGAPGRPPGYPIPNEAISGDRWVEGGVPCNNPDAYGDRHMLIVDRDNMLLYETWATRYNTTLSRWEAGSGAVFRLDRNGRRPHTWTSADAAGLAILPGLVRYEEVFGANPIRHAFRFTTHDTNGMVYPASHEAGTAAGAPPMGTRLRLKSSVDLSGYPPEIQKIFQAMKTYGLILADNGTDMYIQGSYDTRWNNDVLNPAFASLTASDFEVVQLGWFPPYNDVPPTHSFHPWIMRLAKNSITGGCGGGNFCPNSSITRAQMAVFLLAAEHGTMYSPPPATGTVFSDVPANSFAAAWIERLAAEGVTGGCGGGNFCPNSPVTREQMAVFLLTALEGSGYLPPAAVGIFNDVPASSPYARWIEELYNRGITGGCGAGPIYCPTAPNTRGQMAVFVTATFGLPNL